MIEYGHLDDIKVFINCQINLETLFAYACYNDRFDVIKHILSIIKKLNKYNAFDALEYTSNPDIIIYVIKWYVYQGVCNLKRINPVIDAFIDKYFIDSGLIY